MSKNVKVTKQSSSGRNLKFKDIKNGNDMDRVEFVKRIENGNYPDYYVKKVNGLKTPSSKPDGNTNNNLG